MKALLTSIVLLPALVVAQDVEDNAEIDDTIDEITVMGARSLGSLRAEVELAEQAVYDLYNELNDDDAYDIICKKETRIGSQLPKRVCLARMYREAISDATVDEDSGDIAVGQMTDNRKQQRILQEKMRALAIEHPELLNALRTRLVLDRKFEQERERRYGE